MFYHEDQDKLATELGHFKSDNFLTLVSHFNEWCLQLRQLLWPRSFQKLLYQVLDALTMSKRELDIHLRTDFTKFNVWS